MSAQRYRLLTKGSLVGSGVTDSIHVAMAAVAKRSSTAHPHIVANELICSRLAASILLPCPPGAIMEDTGDTYFVSLNFNIGGHSLPPANCTKLIQENSDLAEGILIFDVWVINGDRHRGNLSYDLSTKQVQVFDHSHAFTGTSADISRLFDLSKDKLGIGQHCLKEVYTGASRSPWIDRIRSIPDFFIEGVIDEGCSVGLPASERGVCTEFLKYRRDNLQMILASDPGFFPNFVSHPAVIKSPSNGASSGSVQP